MMTDLSVNDWNLSVLVLRDDCIDVLVPGGEEGPVGATQPSIHCLLEARQICSTDSRHRSGERLVGCYQVNLTGGYVKCQLSNCNR